MVAALAMIVYNLKPELDVNGRSVEGAHAFESRPTTVQVQQLSLDKELPTVTHAVIYRRSTYRYTCRYMCRYAYRYARSPSRATVRATRRASRTTACECRWRGRRFTATWRFGRRSVEIGGTRQTEIVERCGKKALVSGRGNTAQRVRVVDSGRVRVRRASAFLALGIRPVAGWHS